METVVILDNIRSAHNVGSIFRTADGAGVSKIYLGGYTPAPVDRFGRTQPEIAKTSLGATESVTWETAEDVLAVITALRDSCYTIVAVEQDAASVPYTDWHSCETVAFIFGNEVAGVQSAVLRAADSIIEIPMHGEKESLNVGVSAGVILFACT